MLTDILDKKDIVSIYHCKFGVFLVIMKYSGGNKTM